MLSRFEQIVLRFLTILDASWGDRTYEPIYGMMGLQTDGHLYVIEMDVRIYVLISRCLDDGNRWIFAASFGPKVGFRSTISSLGNSFLILTK
jgi:hypothetical protein